MSARSVIMSRPTGAGPRSCSEKLFAAKLLNF